MTKLKVKDLPIIKHSKYYTRKNPIHLSGNEYEPVGAVYYDGESLIATDYVTAIQVWQKLPSAIAGDAFTEKGRKVKVTNFPVTRLNELFNQKEESNAPAVVALNTEELKSWVNVTKDFDDMLSKYRFQHKYHNGNKTVNNKITTLEVSKQEIVLKTDQLYDNHFDNFHFMSFVMNGRVEMNDKYSPIVVRHFNAGYLYRVIKVLSESGADSVEIHLNDQMLFVKSDVGRAIIMCIRG